MRKLMTTVAAAAVALGFAGAAHAEGKVQIKLLGTAVLADGGITGTPTGAAAPALIGSSTSLNDNVVPTLAVEYFFAPNISVETICCFTSHHVTASPRMGRSPHSGPLSTM